MSDKTTMNAMGPRRLRSAIDFAIKIQQPTFIWGSPGVGKSDVVRQAAESNGMALIDVRASLLNPVDLMGIPTVQDGMTTWAIPSMLPQEGRDGKRGVLFMDELTTAPQSVQAACYQLVLDRALGDYRLPDGWTVFAAGNLESDRGVVNKMPTPLANRFAHFLVEPDLKDWVTWAHSTKLTGEVVGFIRYRPELLWNFDPKSGEKAFPTPRSWERVARACAAQPDDDVAGDIYTSLVGAGAAAEFQAFVRLFKNLPDIQQILTSPQKAPVPTDIGELFAISSALTMYANDNTFDRVYQYAKRLDTEYAVYMMVDSVNRHAELLHHGAWTQFGIDYQDVVL
jgi:MoxR-like ATPase